MLIIIILFILPLAIIARRVVVIIQFRKEIRNLFSQAKLLSEKKFSHDQLVGLPEPVQRYFKKVLKEGQTLISYARITHGGQFKTGVKKNWVRIKGEQYATVEVPGFIWKGKSNLFEAKDMYIAREGRLVVFLFSIFKIVDLCGEQYNQGELLRWLGESILYPTNLLPSEKLQWSPISSTTAKLIFNYNGLSLYFIITFNEAGEIIQMQTERYMDKDQLRQWVIKMSNYRQMNGVVVPFKFEVSWKLEQGDFCYAKFDIERIEYDIPVKF